MRFTLDGKEYQIRFKHNKGYRPYLDYDQGVMRGADGTDCYIDQILSDGLRRQVGAGSSMVHPGDQFVKETGRKVALARALKAWGISREQRKVVWEAYHGRTQEGFIRKLERDVRTLERNLAPSREKFLALLREMPQDCGCWKCKGEVAYQNPQPVEEAAKTVVTWAGMDQYEPLPPCTCGKCALEELKRG